MIAFLMMNALLTGVLTWAWLSESKILPGESYTIVLWTFTSCLCSIVLLIQELL